MDLTLRAVFEDMALNALRGLWSRRSPLGLVGAHIDVYSGEWTHRVSRAEQIRSGLMKCGNVQPVFLTPSAAWLSRNQRRGATSCFFWRLFTPSPSLFLSAPSGALLTGMLRIQVRPTQTQTGRGFDLLCNESSTVQLRLLALMDASSWNQDASGYLCLQVPSQVRTCWYRKVHVHCHVSQ